MARGDDLTVTQPVLDRLIDREPNLAADPATARAQSVRQLKAAVRRDLEWLLNTRRNADEPGEALSEVAHSLYCYGLPDFTRLSVDSVRDRNQLTLELESTLAQFEPRLKDVRVSMVEVPNAKGTRVVHFQIEGMLQMDPSPEQVSFDTVLQLTSGEYQIRGDRGA